MTGGVTVGGSPSVSPDSAMWDPWAIARINTDEATIVYWQAQIVSGTTTLYTSDGNPTVTTIPDHLPADLADQFDAGVVGETGRSLVRYSAKTTDEQVNRHPQRDMAALPKWDIGP